MAALASNRRIPRSERHYILQTHLEIPPTESIQRSRWLRQAAVLCCIRQDIEPEDSHV